MVVPAWRQVKHVFWQHIQYTNSLWAIGLKKRLSVRSQCIWIQFLYVLVDSLPKFQCVKYQPIQSIYLYPVWFHLYRLTYRRIFWSLAYAFRIHLKSEPLRVLMRSYAKGDTTSAITIFHPDNNDCGIGNSRWKRFWAYRMKSVAIRDY